MSVFPDLAAGNAAPPFAFLGDQVQYQVAGGKPVFAYRLGSALQTQSIYPGVVGCSEGDRGQGKTAGLGRGPVPSAAGTEASGEATRFGVPIAHHSGGRL